MASIKSPGEAPALPLLLLLLLLVLTVTTVAAKNGAKDDDGEGEGGVCNFALEDLLSCKNAVATGWFKNTDPSPQCCKTVAAATAGFDCFCPYVNYLWMYGIDLDLVKELPAKCNVEQSFPDCLNK